MRRGSKRSLVCITIAAAFVVSMIPAWSRGDSVTPAGIFNVADSRQGDVAPGSDAGAELQSLSTIATGTDSASQPEVSGESDVTGTDGIGSGIPDPLPQEPSSGSQEPSGDGLGLDPTDVGSGDTALDGLPTVGVGPNDDPVPSSPVTSVNITAILDPSASQSTAGRTPPGSGAGDLSSTESVAVPLPAAWALGAAVLGASGLYSKFRSRRDRTS
jgi:hypothetical protein